MLQERTFKLIVLTRMIAENGVNQEQKKPTKGDLTSLTYGN